MSTADEARTADLVEDAIERSRKISDDVAGRLGIYRYATPRSSLECASGQSAGRPLAGVTLGVKDIIFESPAPTTAQSNVALAHWPEGQSEATVVSRLKQAGAVVVGKTATMEYALGVRDKNGPGPVSRNPWAPERCAGGSSSGSGSGVVTGCFDAAVATDTTGSQLGAPRLDQMHPLDPSTYLGSIHTTAWSVTGHPVAVVPIGPVFPSPCRSWGRTG
jgi:aspartyl-tRNA(Asn)/glutamyl-tRNA(Gln) amidotransferase subunit A